ncbi:pilus assembly protein PilP [Aquabacterium lacunae]|jgi:type IV pilus assembly protein PilP|nr:pilus assembly protein PilP [Aquabacterium lacunae]
MKSGLSCLAVMLALGLTACTGELDDLDQWMEDQKRLTPPKVEPLQSPQRFDPQRYEVIDLVEPFSPQKLIAANRQESAQPSALVAAELNRRREPLEAFPLDTVRMVGSVVRSGTQFGLLKVDNLLYQVKVGDYLGQNYGKIMKITETEISLREYVQDASGEWIERPAALQLQEGAQ